MGNLPRAAPFNLFLVTIEIIWYFMAIGNTFSGGIKLVLPAVAIVGRPNVGKSTLFNRILKKKLAVVEDVPGVTRDRNYAIAEYEGKNFHLIDTGGFEPAAEEGILAQMREQSTLAVQEADLVIFVMDAKEGLTASDEKVAEILRRSGKPVLYCLNKVDGPRHEEGVYDFYRLGTEDLYPVSALHGPGFAEMMDALAERLPEATGPYVKEDEVPNIAIIGRPNVGKSSLVNALTGTKRMVAHEEPGTTVDSIDTRVTYYGREYNLIDTAGIRSRGAIARGVEKYSVIRAVKAIERCDVALLMVDASEGLTEQDKKIGGLAHEAGKGIIIVLNKWDLVEKDDSTFGEYIKKIRAGMKYLDYAPIITISALTRQRIGKIYELADEVIAAGRTRVPTPKLNDMLEAATRTHQPPMYKGRRLKFYYITQGAVSPPTFILFVNRPEGVHFSYIRYIENRLRENFGFAGNPVRIFLKKRSRTREDAPGKNQPDARTVGEKA